MHSNAKKIECYKIVLQRTLLTKNKYIYTGSVDVPSPSLLCSWLENKGYIITCKRTKQL